MDSLYFLADAAQDAAAYKKVEIIGVLLLLAVLFGVLVFFCIAVYKSVKKGKTGWIAPVLVVGIPWVILIVAFCILFISGRMEERKEAVVSASQNHSLTTKSLATAVMSPVKGQSISYQISLPDKSHWEITRNPTASADYRFYYRKAYISIIPQNIGFETPERAASLAQKNLMEVGKDQKIGAVKPIRIDGRRWLTFDVTANLKGTNFKYRYYVYSDADYSFQIMCWSSSKHFDECAPIFDRVAHSFKFPAADKPASKTPSTKPLPAATPKAPTASGDVDADHLSIAR